MLVKPNTAQSGLVISYVGHCGMRQRRVVVGSGRFAGAVWRQGFRYRALMRLSSLVSMELMLAVIFDELDDVRLRAERSMEPI